MPDTASATNVIKNSIIDKYRKEGRGEIEIDARSISIALNEEQAMSIIGADIDKNGKDIANYVVLSNKAIEKISDPSSNDINIFNILGALANRDKAFLGIGIDPDKIKDDLGRSLTDLLKGIMATIRIIKVKMEDIVGFMLSVSETSRSL